MKNAAGFTFDKRKKAYLNMVLCVESLIEEQGSESIRLEVQAVVRGNAIERLDSFPFEAIQTVR